MNDKQIAFIICVNNLLYFEECRYYIEQLRIPEGYEIDILDIQEADSMCAAYNLGMNSTNAKYKIYMHQDVFIRNRDFPRDIIAIFKRDRTVGMIGMIGGNEMPKTAVTYLAWNVGRVDCRDADMAYYLSGAPEIKVDSYVEAVDGLLIATQYDVPWREDLFHDFDFYDVSQSFEMRRSGYRVLVPYMKEPWVIHDSSFAKLSHYDCNRKICMAEYPEYFYAEEGFELEYHKEWEELSGALAEQLKIFIAEGKWNIVCQMIAEYRQGKMKDSTLEMIGIMSDIWQAGCKKQTTAGLFDNCVGYEQVYDRYIEIRFLMRRMELGMPEASYQKLADMIKKEELSYDEFMIFFVHAVLDKGAVLQKVRDTYQQNGKKQKVEPLDKLLKKLETTNLPMTYTKRVMMQNS